VCGRGSSEGWGWELKPCLQSITRAGLDVRARQQHVERIYDLVFISLFNTILGALRGRKKRGSEKKRREIRGEKEFHLLVFMKRSPLSERAG